jgi:hypothetical protein
MSAKRKQLKVRFFLNIWFGFYQSMESDFWVLDLPFVQLLYGHMYY